MTRLERTGRNAHEVREVWDHIPAACGCGAQLRPPNISLGSVGCTVHGQQRTVTCRACRTTHVDCPCVTVEPQQLGTGYFRGQHGPTADFGAG